ncbi:MAG: hypothetical protein ABSF50_18665 [Burkholderiaceae bacterium]|jgi:hypothetical protein
MWAHLFRDYAWLWGDFAILGFIVYELYSVRPSEGVRKRRAKEKPRDQDRE